MKRYLYFLIILITILLIGSSIIIQGKLTKETISNYSTIYPDPLEQDLEEIESIIQYGENSVISAHFPIFGIDTLDYMTRDVIESEINQFNILVKDFFTEDKNYKSELNIDYTTYKFSNNIVSIKFLILEDMTYYNHPNMRVVTRTYDIENERLVELQDIMKDNYLNEISRYAVNFFNTSEDYKQFVDIDLFKQNLTPNLSNYSNFILGKDSISFIFQKNELFLNSIGNPTIEIPYKNLDKYLNSYLIDEMPISIVSSMDNSDIITMSKEPLDIHKPTRNIDPTKPMVALTFDDGPNKNTTIPILNTLKEYNGVATFFVLGNRVTNNEDILKRMLSEGSEIGNHSFNHKQLTTITSSEVKDQLDKTQNAIMEVVGTEPKLMRPTYGSYNDDLRSQIEMPMILWSIDTLDWKSRDAEKISNHVLTNVKDGDIILMHDIYGSTADAVKTIVPELVNRGYQLITVSELYELRGETLETGNIYKNSYK